MATTQLVGMYAQGANPDLHDSNAEEWNNQAEMYIPGLTTAELFVSLPRVSDTVSNSLAFAV